MARGVRSGKTHTALSTELLHVRDSRGRQCGGGEVNKYPGIEHTAKRRSSAAWL